jgi:hypothetical protein
VAADGRWYDRGRKARRCTSGAKNLCLRLFAHMHLVVNDMTDLCMLKEPLFMHNTATMHHVQLVTSLVDTVPTLVDTVYTFQCAILRIPYA